MKFSDIGLQRRITLYVAVGLALLITVFSIVALQATARSSDAILEERRVLAQAVASKVDRTVDSASAALQGIASSLDAPTDVSSAARASILQSASDSISAINYGAEPSLVALLRDDGEVIASMGSAQSDRGLVEQFSSFSLSDSVTEVSGESGTLLVGISSRLPSDSSLSLVAAFAPARDLLLVPGSDDSEPSAYRTELINLGGNVLQTSMGAGSTGTTVHADVLADLLSTSGEETSTHSPEPDDGHGVKHVVAYAPLSSLPFGVLLEQPEDITLAIPNSLRTRIYILSGSAFVIALAVAWITTHQVVRPLLRLETQAGRIASGDLGGEVEPTGQDEIRRLATSFEIMRGRLERSQGELAELNQQLEKRVQERTVQLEQRSRERDVLLRRVISAQEDERKRVARDLHDQVGQSLTGLMMNLASAESELGRHDEGSAGRLSELRGSVGDVIDEVRRLMSDLRPSVLDDMGLASAVGWYLENHVERAGLNTTFDATGFEGPVPANTEISAFRVVQEACNNIVKHADARNVVVKLEMADGQLSGVVIDDGAGFDQKSAQHRADGGWAVGLMGMRERVGLLGGSLNIESSPGNGTTVRFSMPVEAGQI